MRQQRSILRTINQKANPKPTSLIIDPLQKTFQPWIVSFRYFPSSAFFLNNPKALRFNRFSPLGSQRSGTDSLFPSSTATSSLDSLLPRPGKPEILGGEVVTVKVPKKTRKTKSLKPKGSLRSAFLSKSVTFKLTVSDHHCIYLAHGCLKTTRQYLQLKELSDCIISQGHHPTHPKEVSLSKGIRLVASCIWRLAFIGHLRTPSWGVLFPSIPRMYVNN